MKRNKEKKVAINTTLVNITPAMARGWLDRNIINRNLREDRVIGYAEQIKAGTFMTTHQGIAFYADGTLADGQHRLSGIVKANLPVKMFVTTGLPRIASQVIDQNTPRAAHDAIRIGGGADWVERNTVAVIRYLLSNMGSDAHAKTVQEIASYAAKYQDDLVWLKNAANHRRKRFVSHAGLLASYFCALRAGVPRETINRFMVIMRDGEIAGHYENAAIRLREYLLNTPGAWGGSTMRSDTTRRTQRAISAFAARQSLARLYAPDTLIYPVPAP
jgi:hypothetical protein